MRREPPPEVTINVHDRLRQLEDQVSDMVSRRPPADRSADSAPLPTPADSVGNTEGSPSVVTSEGFQNRAIPDCSNWASILRELRESSSHIECVRKYRNLPNVEQHKSPRSIPGPVLLYGCLPITSFDELLKPLPSRTLTNRMVSSYFNGLDLSSGTSSSLSLGITRTNLPAIIHGPEFLKEVGYSRAIIY